MEEVDAIAFDPYTHGYYKVTERVGEAFKDGLALKKARARKAASATVPEKEAVNIEEIDNVQKVKEEQATEILIPGWNSGMFMAIKKKEVPIWNCGSCNTSWPWQGKRT